MRSEEVPQLPSHHLARRVREIREHRRWTQQDLANRLAELDFPLGRPAITKIEARDRGVSVDEALALAAALGVAPVHLLVPVDNEAWFALSKKWTVPAPLARDWIRGGAPLGDSEDERWYLTLRPDDEWSVIKDGLPAQALTAYARGAIGLSRGEDGALALEPRSGRPGSDADAFAVMDAMEDEAARDPGAQRNRDNIMRASKRRAAQAEDDEEGN
jgi:transcriptional regulator with XRE-family HTH domain